MITEIMPVSLLSKPRTVVVFDPLWSTELGKETEHTLVIKDLFPGETVFCGINHFTLDAVDNGRVSALLEPKDLLGINPLVFITDMVLIPTLRDYSVALKLIGNIKNENSLNTVPFFVITDQKLPQALRKKLFRLGIDEDRIFSWMALLAGYNFKRQMDILSYRLKI